MGIKTRNILLAGLASFNSTYEFTPEIDTLFSQILSKIENGDKIITEDSAYSIIETYNDPDGWFKYKKVDNKVNFWTKDSVIYAVVREKPLRDNGKPYFILVRLFKRKEEKHLFKNFNPNSKIEFYQVNEIKQ